MSKRADNERAHSIKRILVKLESKRVSYSAEERGYWNGVYHITLNYSVQNNAKAAISSFELETYVYDKDGKQLGTVRTSFSGLNLQPGSSTELQTTISDGVPVSDTFFISLYEIDLSIFQIEYKITGVNYKDGSFYSE